MTFYEETYPFGEREAVLVPHYERWNVDVLVEDCRSDGLVVITKIGSNECTGPCRIGIGRGLIQTGPPVLAPRTGKHVGGRFLCARVLPGYSVFRHGCLYRFATGTTVCTILLTCAIALVATV